MVETEKYKFSYSGVYHSIETDNMAELLDYVNSLPDLDPSEIFGMNENADVVVQMTDSLILIETVLSLEPRVGGGIKGA